MIGHALRTSHLLQGLHQFVTRDTEIFENFGGGNIRGDQRQQIVLGTGELIFQDRHLFFRAIKHAAKLGREANIGGAAGNSGATLELGRQSFVQLIDRYANFFEQRPRDPLALIKQRGEEMFVVDFLMIKLRSDILRRL